LIGYERNYQRSGLGARLGRGKNRKGTGVGRILDVVHIRIIGVDEQSPVPPLGTMALLGTLACQASTDNALGLVADNT